MSMNYVERGDYKTIYFTPEDNERCLTLLSEWRPRRLQAREEGDLSKAPIPPFLAVCIQKIAEKISHRHNYRDYHFKDDMVSDAVINLLRYLHGFNPERIGERSGKVNFFSWVTSCVDKSFGNMILSERDQEYYKLATFEELGGFAAFSEDGDFMAEGTLTSDMAQDFIAKAREFESAKSKRIARQKERAKIKAEKIEAEKAPEPVRVNPIHALFRK